MRKPLSFFKAIKKRPAKVKCQILELLSLWVTFNNKTLFLPIQNTVVIYFFKEIALREHLQHTTLHTLSSRLLPGKPIFRQRFQHLSTALDTAPGTSEVSH